MASLLTDDEFAEIRETIHDVTDTFLRLPVIWKKDKNTATRMMRDIDHERQYDDINLQGLVVWEDKGNKAILAKSLNGAVDLADGYVLFNYDDAQAAGVVTLTHNQIVNPAKDYLVFDNEKHEILGLNMLGQLKDKNCLLKVHFKKNIRTNDGTK